MYSYIITLKVLNSKNIMIKKEVVALEKKIPCIIWKTYDGFKGFLNPKQHFC